MPSISGIRKHLENGTRYNRRLAVMVLRRRTLRACAWKGLGSILAPPVGGAGQIHFNHGFFKKNVKDIFDCSSDGLLGLISHGILVNCCNRSVNGLVSWLIESRQLNHTDGVNHVLSNLEYAAFEVRKIGDILLRCS